MDLFTPIVDAEHLHPNFKAVQIMQRAGEVAVVKDWADGFPDRDGKFVDQFQRTFNSCFWEVYLHGLFKDYGFEMDWAHPSPDFWLKTPLGEVIVEAVTANEADGAEPEWGRKPIELIEKGDFWPLNRVAIIRLANALLSKVRKYERTYRALPHVPRKPFVIAVAPFEQPFFNHQYDRPIQALLYDYYVDEQAYKANPSRYPNGPPGVKLGDIKKDNGAVIDLGLFLDDRWREVSAVIFSCTATWGKAVAMSSVARDGVIHSVWGQGEFGKPDKREKPIGVPSEGISDGLMVFHNHYATNPLSWDVFHRPGVIQVVFGPDGVQFEGRDQSLQFRVPTQWDRDEMADPGDEAMPS
ncbi:hypothetical protein [Pelomonas sp. Root1237]|uniref:hypothetical protein n=1 Tax=Pelomonas sp. Root1237 TaxID=1736434 RepID=UPI0012F8F8CD|nr:hypothetical protein [Pelomonas sp. Root1237]